MYMHMRIVWSYKDNMIVTFDTMHTEIVKMDVQDAWFMYTIWLRMVYWICTGE